VLRQPDVIAIPKAASASHLRENFEAAQLTLGKDDYDGHRCALPAAEAQAGGWQ
jgi:diketogulonate reductase-like aldo/keto reductase